MVIGPDNKPVLTAQGALVLVNQSCTFMQRTWHSSSCLNAPCCTDSWHKMSLHLRTYVVVVNALVDKISTAELKERIAHFPFLKSSIGIIAAGKTCISHDGLCFLDRMGGLSVGGLTPKPNLSAFLMKRDVGNRSMDAVPSGDGDSSLVSGGKSTTRNELSYTVSGTPAHQDDSLKCAQLRLLTSCHSDAMVVCLALMGACCWVTTHLCSQRARCRLNPTTNLC